MPATLAALPTELHEQILHHLPWHDHFLAASVLPLWSSLLQTTPFRQKRHYDDLRNVWHFTPTAFVTDLIFNRPCPTHRYNDKDKDLVSKLHLHALLDRRALEIVMERGGEARVVMNIPRPGQEIQPPDPNPPSLQIRAGEEGKNGEKVGDGNVNSLPSSIDENESVTSYNITSSPLLLSDTVVYSIGPGKDYPVFDDRFAPQPHNSEIYENMTVHFPVPLDYPELLGNEKPQSLMGMVEDVVSYMNGCFETERNAEWMRAVFQGYGGVHHTDEVHFEIRYGKEVA
ncbi:hypothetical protein TWF481_011354 [Arthrobotrys musiformis]|uniref:F-box domain-containing protein n=1 Tax=Arthrobotrys musiformis TaxID=47236 RepID=A0AAV9VZJ1_9PEZI